jgi:quercetin dioxygenase-like cupin family protein
MRRIVTAATGDGRSVVIGDGLSPHVVSPDGLSGVQLVDLWASEAAPRLPFTGGDPAQQMPLLPGPGATAFRLVRIARRGGMSMHATSTVDYLVVLSGRVTLEIEGAAEFELSAGDCVVQLGARHAWHNRSDDDCVLAAVVVGAKGGTAGAS